MLEFVSWQSYSAFSWSVKRKARHVLEPDVVKFLETVIQTSAGRKRVLPQDRFLWRAQLGHGWRTLEQDGNEFDVPDPFPRDRMKPLKHAAHEGRVNAKGVPCLYLSADKETAMAEVRPWIGSYVSVGQFKTIKEVTLVDCTVEHGTEPTLYFEEPDSSDRERSVWRDIDNAFSEPVTESDSDADYAPTQVLAEYFRANGYDGIAYKSSLGRGLNVALFNTDNADMVNCFLHKTVKISFDFGEPVESYFIRRRMDGHRQVRSELYRRDH